MAGEREDIEVQVVKGVPARMKWTPGEDVDPVFADQMHLAKLNDLFYLTFGQARLLASPDAHLEGVTEIRPISRMIIPKKALGQLADLLKRALDEWEE